MAGAYPTGELTGSRVRIERAVYAEPAPNHTPIAIDHNAGCKGHHFGVMSCADAAIRRHANEASIAHAQAIDLGHDPDRRGSGIL